MTSNITAQLIRQTHEYCSRGSPSSKLTSTSKQTDYSDNTMWQSTSVIFVNENGEKQENNDFVNEN